MTSIRNAIVAALASVGIGCEGNTPTSSQQLNQIRQLPIGLKVIHAPNPVRAAKNGQGGLRFTWTYSTSVFAIDKSLTIVEFGSFAEQDGEWVFANHTGQPFTTKDFSDWYTCPNGSVHTDRAAVDPHNWTGSNELVPGRMLWYFIGADDAGNRFRGEAVVEMLGERVGG